MSTACTRRPWASGSSAATRTPSSTDPPGLADGRRGPLRHHPEPVARDHRRATRQHGQQEPEVSGVGREAPVQEDDPEQGPEEALDRLIREPPLPQEVLGRPGVLAVVEQRLRRSRGHLDGQAHQLGPVRRGQPGEAGDRQPGGAQPVRPRPVDEHRPAPDGAQIAPGDPDRAQQGPGARVGAEQHLEAAVHRASAVPHRARAAAGRLLGLQHVHGAPRARQVVRAGQSGQAAPHDDAVKLLRAPSGSRHRRAMVQTATAVIAFPPMANRTAIVVVAGVGDEGSGEGAERIVEGLLRHGGGRPERR